jgi:hypothetical protein
MLVKVVLVLLAVRPRGTTDAALDNLDSGQGEMPSPRCGTHEPHYCMLLCNSSWYGHAVVSQISRTKQVESVECDTHTLTKHRVRHCGTSCTLQPHRNPQCGALTVSHCITTAICSHNTQ